MRRLKSILSKKSGRALGTVVVRHQGGRAKRFFREVDFKRTAHEAQDVRCNEGRTLTIGLSQTGLLIAQGLKKVRSNHLLVTVRLAKTRQPRTRCRIH